MKEIEFYFDFISPFGFLASRKIGALAEKYGYSCRWQAMLLGVSVLKVMGMKPLASIPLKGDYQFHEMKRNFRREGIVLGRSLDAPPAYPVLAGRAFHWVEHNRPDLAERFAIDVFNAYWIDDRTIDNPEILGSIYAALDQAADPLLDALGNGEGDRLLRAAVDRSLSLGVFGSPFFRINGEPFFGYDKFDQMEAWLASGGW